MSLSKAASSVVVLIPSYRPGDPLLSVIAALNGMGFRCCVVIDGMDEADAALVARLDESKQVDLVRHYSNLGKGRSLKTGLNHILNTYADLTGVVTADADGQHRPEDIRAIAEAHVAERHALIIGSRSFENKVPLRSKFGNVFTRTSFRIFAGTSVHDTQSGMRGLPIKAIPELLKLHGERYDYELSVLIHFSRYGKIIEVPITTIYKNDNAGTFFKPIRDSVLIYYTFIKYSLSSFSTSVIDNIVFSLAYILSGNILGSLIVGRITSGSFNFSMNKKLVFKNNDPLISTALKYGLSILLFLTVSYASITALVLTFDMNIWVAKVISELFVFFLNFIFQRSFVFSENSS